MQRRRQNALYQTLSHNAAVKIAGLRVDATPGGRFDAAVFDRSVKRSAAFIVRVGAECNLFEVRKMHLPTFGASRAHAEMGWDGVGSFHAETGDGRAC